MSCYEAGQDGFWPHRQLTELGIDNRVVDYEIDPCISPCGPACGCSKSLPAILSASIEVNRRRRRAKTDRLDVRKLVEMLVRSQQGECKVWQEVKIPSVAAEDQRRLQRELGRTQE